MTLKGLLLKVEFDDVAPFIFQHYLELSHCMAGFKMAFDGMGNTLPADANGETIKVELFTEEGEEPYLSAFHVDNDSYGKNLFACALMFSYKLTKHSNHT